MDQILIPTTCLYQSCIKMIGEFEAEGVFDIATAFSSLKFDANYSFPIKMFAVLVFFHEDTKHSLAVMAT